MKCCLLRRCTCLTINLLGIVLCFNTRAVPSLRLEISPPSGANEYTRGASIEWDGQRDVTYKIQSATALRDASVWKTEDIVMSSSNGPVRWMAPEALSTEKYYRLLLPQPEVFSVEPSFVDSSDPTALLYILGQLLPTNGFVVINGRVITPTIIDSNGVWAAVSLNGLPPGGPIITLTVMDSGSNVVATLPIQGPILYGTELTLEQLQGPPEDPPAVVKTKTKSNQSNDRLGGGGGIGVFPEPETAQGKSTPVTRSNISNNRSSGGGGGIGGIPEPELTQGKSTPVTRSNISNNRSAGGGGGGGGIGGLPEPEMAQGKSTPVTRSNISNNRSSGGSGYSIALASGEVACEETDLVIPAPGFDFAWTRTYRSRTGPTTSLGHGWDFAYNMRLSLQGDGTVQFCSGNGRCDTFYPNGTNGWSRDEFFMTIGDVNKDGIPDVVICADGTRINFNPIAMDKPVSITDRNNNTMTFGYDGLGRLTTIVDTLGRTNIVAYNSSGLLGSVTDFSGRTVRYEYDGNGDLVRCVSPEVTGTPNGNDFPGGKTNSYTYSSGFGDDRLNHNLTSCTDAKGQTWLQVVYQPTNDPVSVDFDAVAYTLRGIERKDVWRGRVTPSPTNGFATIQVTMRDAVGNVTECFFDSRQRCVRRIDYTGRSATNAPVTPLTNRPKNKLRSSDPDFYETEWQWNSDSLCRAMYVNPRSISRQQYFFAYERDFNPQCSPRKRGDLRVYRESACCGGADLDGDGVLDIADRAWHFEYDPNFGSGNTRQRIDELESHLTALGLLVPGNGVAINTKGTGADKNRVASIPLGNGVAINVKGTGADKGRLAPIPVGNGVAINTKGTGADKGRFANGPRQTTSTDGSYSAMHAINTKGAGTNGRLLSAVRTSVQDFEKNTEYVKGGGELCDNGNGSDDGDSFITAITDPRGNTTTASYDANGNCNVVNPRAARDNFLQGAADIAMRFAYNPRGQLSAITNLPDANGYRRVDTFDYYTNGSQAGYCSRFVVDATGPIVTVWNFQYDSRGNLTRLVDPRTNDCLFTWNQLDQLVERQNPDRGFGARTATTYTYDANNNVVRSETELRGSTDIYQHQVAILYEYDSVDRLVSLTAQVATNQFVTNKFVYDANDNCIQIHSPLSVAGADPHNYMAYEYDERGLLFREITAPNSGQSGTNEWGYDERYHPATKQYLDASENIMVASYTYDGFGRPATVTDAMGNVAMYNYDRNDNLVLFRAYCETNDMPGNAGNLRYHEWRWVYDDRDRCIESRGSFFDPTTQKPISDGLSVRAYAYAPNGACASVTDDNGHVTRFSYDTSGRLASVTDAKTNIVAFVYDPNGNVVNVTRTDRSDLTQTTQQFLATYVYDALNRCVSRVDNVGNTNRYSYDSLNRTVQSVDPKGNTRFNTYDDLGRCTLVVADMNGDGLPDLAADVNHSWTYDDNSRCISSTDDNTNTTSYAYDSCDRLVATTEADGTMCSLIWSPRSNLLRQQDANGTVISNSFDALGRCISRQITPGSGVATTTSFEHYVYDGLSRLTAASNDVSFVIIGYDSFGNPGPVNENGQIIGYTYDGVGNRTSMTYPSGTAVGYTYDACDQVSQITRCEGCGNPWLGNLVATFAYEGPGRVGRIMRANGVNTRVTWDGVSGTPNAAGDFGWLQVNSVNHQVSGGGAIIDRRAFAFDRNQNKIQRAQIAPFFPGGHMNTNQFVYDPLDRLTTYTRSSGTPSDIFKSYVLDGNGNRQIAFSNGLAQPYFMDKTPPPGPADFQMNQYTTTPFGTQIFDENGNLSSRLSSATQLQFQCDYANRLVAVNDLSAGFAAPIATFAYDALGRRISKTVYPPLPLSPVTIEYVHEGPDDCDDKDERIIETRIGSTVGQAFVLDGTRSHDDEVVRLVSGQPQYFHRDDLGNVLALTDAGGNVIERYDYDDFGAPTFLTSDGVPMGTNTSPAGNTLLFHGMEWDSEVGLYFGHSQGGTTGPILRTGSGDLLWNNDPYAEDSMRTYDPFSGRYLMRAGVPLRFDAATTFADNNPWSGPGRSSFRLGPANGGVEQAGSGSARVTREILKTYFEKGDQPTQSQFKFQHRMEYGQTLPDKRQR